VTTGPLCNGCPNQQHGVRFISFDGLGTNKVLLLGDAGTDYDVRLGRPLQGPSGYFIERQLKRIGAERSQFLISNALWCKAKHPNWIDYPHKFPDAALSLEQCRPYLDELVERMQPKVVVPMGNVALRRATGESGIERHHAYYMNTPWGIPAIPTFLPSYIIKGNAKLSGLWCYAVKRALDVASKAEKPKQYDLLLDPPVDDARRYLSRPGTLVCDIETPMNDNVEEDERDDASYTIVRVSFSNLPGTAISLPWHPPYIDLMREVLGHAKELVFWNQNYDLPRLRANGCVIGARVVDAMFAWHWLQSDLPKALAFVAPLFMCVQPWKQMVTQEPARYSALDSAITMDTYLGIKGQLEAEGRWKAFESHCVDVFPIFEKMSGAGVMLDLEHQAKFKTRLEGERDTLLAEMQPKIPLAVRPEVTWKKKGPQKPELWPDLQQLPDGTWLAHEAFNPGSSDQVKALIRTLGLTVPKVKGEDRETTEAKHLKSLSRKNKIFSTILEYRERAKLIDSYMWEVKDDGRIHTTFSFHPSTWRKSARDPNVQTVPKRNDLAAEFRRMVIAAPGCTLIECDSSAIEAVLVGFFANSPRYIELAKKGVHKWLASEYAQRPVSKSEPLYDQMKRIVHLSNYMGTAQRIVEEYPGLFASVKDAKKIQDFYFGIPAGQDIKKWHQQVLEQAHKERFLENPWKYRHYFYSVFQYSDGKWSLGDDAKRAVAFLPQATASAIQSDFLLEIQRTHSLLAEGLRWIIHDSIVCEVPTDTGMVAAHNLRDIMQMPHPLLGGLAIGGECKVGPNLAEMETIE
jgi:uracil-DNA glycosylase family 4